MTLLFSASIAAVRSCPACVAVTITGLDCPGHLPNALKKLFPENLDVPTGTCSGKSTTSGGRKVIDRSTVVRSRTHMQRCRG